MENYGIQEKDLARFKAFLKNEPVMAVLNRNRTFLLDEGKRIQSIEINENMESYTDGKKVVVSGLPPMITPEFDRRGWLIMMRVNLAHEIQHDNSSDFDLIKGIQEWFGDYLFKTCKIRKEIGAQIGHSVLNCVEDGRINEIVVQRFPGYLGMMRMVNFAIREEGVLKEAAKDPGQELIDFQNQILSYSKTGMNLPGIKVYQGTRLEKEFAKIKGFIDEGVASPTAKGCYDACVKLLETAAPYIADLARTASNIMDILEKLFKENYSQSSDTREEEKGNNQKGNGPTVRLPSKKQKNQSGKDGKDGKPSKSSEDGKDDKDGNSGKDSKDQKDGKDSQSGKDGKNGNSGKSGKDGKDGASGTSDKEGQGDGAKSQAGNDGNSSSQQAQNSDESASELAKRQEINSIDDVIGAGFDEEQSPPATEKELEEMLDAAAEELQRAAAYEASQHVEAGKKTPLSRSDMADLKERYGTIPSLREKFIIPTKKNTSPLIMTTAKRLHERLATILVKRRSAASGYRKGYIDPGKLWRVGIGSGEIFQRKQPPKLSDCAVYELIDGSGSMAEHAYSQSGKSVNKLISALTTAAIMEESLKGLASTKITIFRAGWGSEVEHVVIKDFDQKPIGNRCFDSMTEVGPSSGNKDGFSIRIAAMDLAKRPEKTKILLVLSDGLPSAYNNTDAAVADVRSAAKWARAHGITVISIMFGEDNFLKNNYKSYQKMYEQDIIAVRPANITREFEHLLAKLIK